MAIFAFPVAASGKAELRPESVALSEHAGNLLAKALSSRYRVVPLDWLFEPASPDSLLETGYQIGLANRLFYPYYVVGVLQEGRDSTWCQYVFFQRDKAAPVRQGRYGFATANLMAGAQTLANEIFLQLEKRELDPPPALSPPSPAYAEARLAHLTGAYQQARHLATTMIRRDSTDIHAYEILAATTFVQDSLVNLEKKDREAKLYVLTEKLANFSDRDTATASLARLAAQGYLWQEKFNLAEMYLARALRHSDHDSKVNNLLANFHFSRFRQLGYHNEAEIYEKSLEDNPGDVAAYLDLAAVYIQLNKIDKAQAAIERGLAINSVQPKLLAAAGQIYVMRGLTEKTFATYQRLLQLQPDNADAFYNLGIYYYQVGDFKTATRFFERAIALNNHRDSRLYLAKIAEQEGRLDDAVAFLRARIKLSFGDHDAFAEEARTHLFQIMVATGKIDSTGKVIRK